MKNAEEAQDATQNRLRKEGHSFAPGPEGQEHQHEEATQEEEVTELTVFMTAGEVVHGFKGKWHAPTANVQLGEPIEPGIFTCHVYDDGELLGQALVWSSGLEPMVEVYIGEFDRDLYGRHLVLWNLQRLDRSRLSRLCDQAIRAVPLSNLPRYTGQSE